MKILTLLLLLCNASLQAQLDITKPVPIKIYVGEGIVKDYTMAFRVKESLKNPNLPLKLTAGIEHYKTSPAGLGTFIYDEKIWVLRNVPYKTYAYPANAAQMVILHRQGVIEQYEYIYYGEPNDTLNSLYTGLLFKEDKTKIVTCKTTTKDCVVGNPTVEKVRQWIADIPESAEDLKNAEASASTEQNKQKQDSTNTAGAPKKEAKKGFMGALQKVQAFGEDTKKKESATLDLWRVISNYNFLYDQANRDKIKYVFVSPPSWKPLPKAYKTNAERKAEAESAFEGRSSTASPDIASAKDNEPVKKETFAAKMARIKSEGNKIGVYLYVRPARVPKPEGSMAKSSAFGESLPIEGEYMDESLKTAGADIVNELNQALSTTDIELIDISKIPYRDVRVLGIQSKVDDWWATKYKVVFQCTVDPQIKALHDTFMKEKIRFKADLNFICSMVVREYIGASPSNKQDIITQVQNYGYFTASYVQDEDMKDIKQIYDKLLEKLGTPILERMKAERVQGVKKLVEKRLAP